MKILVTGSKGFLGKRLCRLLKKHNLDFVGTSYKDGVDLREMDSAKKLFETENPDYVINCASFVGGIHFGIKHQGELFYNNMRMHLNLLECSRLFKVKRVVNPIPNCAYPADARFFREDEFWDGPLHESVLAYGFARKASWVGSWAYNQQYGTDWVNLILSNMYGPEDHFEAERSHALGALIMKFDNAKRNNIPEVIVWGTGKPVREWLYVDDGAESLIRALEIVQHPDILNVGVGKGISVIELAELIAENIGYKGKLTLDPTKPDGAPYKTVDGTRLEKLINWSPQVSLKEGIKTTVDWYLKNKIEKL